METIASESLKYILEKLIEAATEKIELVRSFKKELADLEEHFVLIKEVLEDAERRKINDASVKSWLKKLEVAAYDAENVLDEIKYEDSRREVETQHKPKWCLNVPCCTNTNLAFRWKMAHKIEDINANFKRINNRANSLGLNRVKEYPPAMPNFIDTTSISYEKNVIGRDDDEKQILEKITSTTINDVLSVLPIVGMGGLGKTTLARKIFNHPRTRTHFDERIWLNVSENFDQMTLFKGILELLGKDFNVGRLEAAVQKIAEGLKNKRYLIVLDDLWNEQGGDWNAFKDNLVGASSNNGNFIIVTTRIEGVASIVKTCNDPYRLRLLTDRECWSIIKKMTFEDKEVPKPFEVTGIEIAGKCRGLPLAANVVGRVLQGKEREEWLSILRNGLSNLKEGDEGVLEILKISYDRLLSSSVKKCFVYCSLFVKDSDLYRINLIQLWMAEGFLPNNQESDMETEGNKIFNILLQNFFFQEPEEDEYGNIISCKMHDIVHDLSCSVSKSAGFLNMEGRTVRHLSTKSVGEDIKEKASYLRTLFLTNRVPDEFFPYLKHLHVLTLSDAGINFLPTSIGKLKHLRYLNVYKSVNYYLTMPESVCKLYNLQTLSFSSAVTLKRLPKDLQFLIHLRHLLFDYVDYDFEMPPGIRRLSSLQTLPLFCASNKEGCRIDELGELKNLKGTLQITNLELVSSKTEAEKADMAGKLNIYELHFRWTMSEYVNSTESNINAESVLEGLQPHENLKSLRIEGFRGKNFPSWTRNMEIYKGVRGPRVTLDKLIKIEFYNCECEEIPMLGHLPLLKYLKLFDLKSVTSIRPSFYGESDCSSTSSNDGQETRLSFPSLISLTIQFMPNLIEWEETQTSGMQVFPCLEYLVINRCEKLIHVPHLRGSGLPLKEMEIQRCQELRELPYDLGSLQSLEKLEICHCSSLESISYQNGKKGLSSLQSLSIRYCNELSNLPNKMLEFSTSLQDLEVSECHKLTSLPEMSGMESLQHLNVSGLNSLTSFPEMSGMRSLQNLEFSICDYLIQFPKLSGMGCLNSLRELKIKGFTNSVQFNTFQDSFNGIEHLEKLSLYGHEDCVSLPNQLHHLTSLEKLEICGFGMEELPDWFGNLSSLEILILRNCEKLRHLPSKEAIQRLTRLRELQIWKCLVLGERCRQESGPDSEWSKISHISRVRIEDRLF